MIQIFTCKRHTYTIDKFLKLWGEDLIKCIQLRSYESLFRSPVSVDDVIIFSDLERLTFFEQYLATWFCRQIHNKQKKVLVLNRPSRVMTRRKLLQTLHAKGINSFAIHRIWQQQHVTRFPVFIRQNSDHQGNITPLLYTQAELKAAIKSLPLSRKLRWHDLLIIEYVHTATDGIFRKYSVMRIGPYLVPKHVFFSKNWVQKYADLISTDLVAEEVEFLSNFPHRNKIEEIFEIAGIEYGRIDYSIVNGQIQVWEINTNPTLMPEPKDINKQRLQGQSESAQQMIAAFAALCSNEKSTEQHSYTLLPGIILGLVVAAREQLNSLIIKFLKFKKKYKNSFFDQVRT